MSCNRTDVSVDVKLRLRFIVSVENSELLILKLFNDSRKLMIQRISIYVEKENDCVLSFCLVFSVNLFLRSQIQRRRFRSFLALALFYLITNCGVDSNVMNESI